MRELRVLGLLRVLRPLGVVGVLGLAAACSDDSGGSVVPEAAPTEAIVFAGGLASVEDVTRAAGLEDYSTTFRVWAYKNMSYDNTSGYGDLQTVMPGYTVSWAANTAHTTTTNTNEWEYVGVAPDQDIKYWDWSAHAYRFFGVTNWGGTTTGTTGTAGTTGTTGTAGTAGATGTAGASGATGTAGASGTAGTAGANGSYEIMATVDASSAESISSAPFFSELWFSTGNLADYPTRQFGRTVQLRFVKPFSRVRYIFRYIGDVKPELTNSRFGPTSPTEKIQRKGTVTFSYPLTGTAIRETVTAVGGTDATAIAAALGAFTEDYDPDATTKIYSESDNGWYTVLPATSQSDYTVSVAVNGEPKTSVVPAQYMSWLPGYQYTYIFKITEAGGIEIEQVMTAFTPWNVLEREHSVYNW